MFETLWKSIKNIWGTLKNIFGIKPQAEQNIKDSHIEKSNINQANKSGNSDSIIFDSINAGGDVSISNTTSSEKKNGR